MIDETFLNGTHCWFHDDQEAWISAEYKEHSVEEGILKLIFLDDNGKEHVVKTKEEDFKVMENSSILQLRNPPMLEATEDLINLSYLNEPSGNFTYD
ncbi:hypothetical protein T552_01513 [Pneumocystis carinii B80]|uniref:Myosin N-terminal SH3-like domain-containing protein n=1 Tax=Pneumocystis carinii (strain B80) TaxID=1408658 RepID=A0A0W4ZKJ2_PNEC8|nr:hypothetical protein T552_01513 [Pneumocystis carinii B80]KTW28884.1 hypothetical protein T552_01513 [Pneumocystis carinii B80]